jgi:putative FmdB family regulatory protein
MPTYEYKCEKCSLRFERRQPITDAPVAECPECGGEVHRLMRGGAGFFFKSSGHGRIGRHQDGCSLESSGKTCCGRDERCEETPCRGER